MLRRGSGRNWAYPGPGWFLVATVTPALFAAYFFTHEDPASRPAFDGAALLFSAFWQTWLFSLRAMISTSVSLAADVKERSLPILRSTPLGMGRMLATKMGVCLFPLFIELALLLPFNMSVHGWLGGSSYEQIALFWVLQCCTTILFGGLGLWLGAIVGDPERVAGNARALVFMALLGCLALEKALTWPLMLTGCLIWLCLVVQPQPRPHQAYQGGVTALVLLLLLPFLYGLTLSFVPHFELSEYNPLMSLLNPGHILTNCALYLTLGVTCFLLAFHRVRTSN